MQIKSLTVAAFILGLGVVAGCDDPEAESKIANALLHGAVSAEVKCAGTVDTLGCDVSAYEATAHLFIDSSSIIRYTLKCGYGSADVNSTTFNSRGTPVSTGDVRLSGGITRATLGEGKLTFDFEGNIMGSSTLDHHPYIELDDNDCNGYNLSEFGLE